MNAKAVITKSTQMTPALFEKLACPCCGWQNDHGRVPMMHLIDNIQDAIRILELHGQENVAFKVHSAWRCEKHNRKAGGGKHSQHTVNAAIDGHFEADDFPIYILSREVIECLHDFRLGGGVGYYRWGLHLDVRGKRVRWSA